MQVYTELTPPTAVTHSVNLSFLSPKSHNLIVAKTSLLQIFELKSVVTEVNQTAKDGPTATSPGADPSEPADLFVQRTEHTSKLILVAEYPLSGTILSLARIKALDTKSGGDALLIAFRDAKMSLVEWDPVNHTLSTISIHYYEGEELQGSPWDADLNHHHNFLVADPSSRCAALKFGARHLAILPFRQLGDDLVEEDYDPDFDEPLDAPAAKEKAINGENGVIPTPYKASFALSLPQLDPKLTHPVHLDFLYEYREPTFGIISASRAAAASLLYERKDVLTYTVFTLDLEEKASTALLSVTGLPYDTSRVIPLPLPVGGALLVGGNQIIHVDQAGKTNAVGVNDFAKQASAFPMADQSDLAMRLEDCTVEQLSPDNGDMLVILRDGSLAILSFKLDGRSVSGLSIQRVSLDKGGFVVQTAASCASSLGRGRVFLGSEDGDAVILGWTRKTAQLSRKRSHAEMLADDADLSFDEDDLEDEDDLYADGATTTKAAIASVEAGDPGSYTFRIHDILPSLGPINEVTLGSHKAPITSGPTENVPEQLDLILSTGRGKASALAIASRGIDPTVLRTADFTTARAVWSVHAKKPTPKGMVPTGDQDAEAKLAADVDYDQFLIVSRANEEGGEESAVYEIKAGGFEETSRGDFEREDAATIAVGTIAQGTRIVQVLKGEIRSYDSELSLDQILPMEDDNGNELRIISASFADPYVLVLREDSSVIILEASANGEMEEIDRGDPLLATKWLSGCIFKSPSTGEKALVYLLSAEGGMHVFELPNLTKPVYVVASLAFLPPILTADFTPRRSAAKATLTEILVAELGDSTSKSPFLIVRSSANDLVIYQPYHHPPREQGQPFTTSLRWHKVFQPRLPEYSEEPALEVDEAGRESILSTLPNVGGYSAVFLAGTSPSFILKEACSSPKVLKIRSNGVKNLSAFHTAECDRGFAFVDTTGILRVCKLPRHYRFGDTGWAVRKISIGHDVPALTYHPPKDVCVVAVAEKEDFVLPEDEHHHEWLDENIAFKPQVERGIIKVFETQNWTTIDTYELEPTEAVLTIKTLNLETSETTHERKPLIAIGTGFIRGEDLPMRGCIYIFEIINVVPEPGHPETNRKLKLIAKEEVRGAVTAITEVGSQGFLLMAQGQKCMVRGLKEDGTLLPVAFMDMQCYVTVAKELKGTGMLLMGDVAKGVWFTGYTEDPYKMLLFGKSRSHMEVMAAEFLPHEKQLYMIIADAECNLHVLQYDPEHPKSLSGQRLLQKSTFHTGQFVTRLTLLPSTLSPSISAIDTEADADAMAVDTPNLAPPGSAYNILVTTQSGALALITPVDEQMYRRLGALQTFLVNSAGLEHWCGLNPRAYRAVESEGFGSRGIVDGTVLNRWTELGEQRRKEACAKVGVLDWVVRSDLEFVGGGGLGYL